MSVKALLDDAAAQATAGLRVDAAAATRRAAEHRAAVRGRASMAMASAAALAAVVTLIAVLLPGGVDRVIPRPPAGAPAPSAGGTTGVPRNWFYAPPWTPEVTRKRMSVAVMVIATPLQQRWETWRGDGPVLVSPDGSRYASLPWTRWDSRLALAADGRDVAWVTQGGGNDGSGRAVVHRLTLAEGRIRDTRLQPGVRVDRLSWSGDRLLVGVRSGSEQVRALVLAAGSDTPQPGGPPPPELTRPVPPSPPADSGVEPLVSPFAGLSPRGDRSVDLVTRPGPGDVPGAPGLPDVAFALRVQGPGGVREIPVEGADPITDVQVLGWSSADRLLVRVSSQNVRSRHDAVSVRSIAADGGASVVLSRRSGTHARVVAVAPEVVGASSVAAEPPVFPEWDRAHLRFIAHRALGLVSWSSWFLLPAGAVVLLLLVVRRRQGTRSRAGEPAAEA